MTHKISLRRKVLLICIFILLFGVACYLRGRQASTDLITNHDWSHFAGAEVTSAGIRIKPLGAVITHKDTSAGQPNPPVNVRGPHLQVSGDFQIDAEISDIDGVASLQLYGQVPVVYDEWRQETPSIRVDVSSGTLLARIWDGSSSNSIDERRFKIPTKTNGKLTLRHQHNLIIILLNGKRLGHLPDHSIFEQNTVWFGTDASLGSNGWVLKSLRAKQLGTGAITAVDPPSIAQKHENADALRNIVVANPRAIPIGVAVSPYPLFTNDQYRDIVLGQFSMITPENSMKPQAIHPQKNTYSFTDADNLIDIAQANQMVVHGHSLVMPKANAQWMENTPKDKRKQVLVDHITTVATHFKGRVIEWDVVNEPMSEESVDYLNGNLGLRPQMWFDAMGEEYIDVAFRAARAADPNAKLYLNDFGLAENNERWNGFIALITRLQARGVPIDGVGFESHVYHAKDSINTDILRQHIRQLAALGIVSRISEIDVLGDDPGLQASQYAGVLAVCLSEPTCTSYGTWGVTDLYGSTTISDRYPPHLGDSLLWGKDMRPKAAYAALQLVLKIGTL